MVPFDWKVVSKLAAAIEQIEASIEQFHAKRYGAAITLAGAAEECARGIPAGSAVGEDDDLPGLEPLFVAMKRVALEQHGDSEAGDRFNRVRNWLKHKIPGDMEIHNYDALSMIARALSVIEPSNDTPIIKQFCTFTRDTYSAAMPGR